MMDQKNGEGTLDFMKMLNTDLTEKIKKSQFSIDSSSMNNPNLLGVNQTKEKIKNRQSV
jgi:hypothetical protein